jgi:hypothetical protein
VGHQGAITCMAIANSSDWLVSGSDDATLRIWNTFEDVKKFDNSDTFINMLPPVPVSCCVGVLAGHAQSISGVVVTPSDRCAILLTMYCLLFQHL